MKNILEPVIKLLSKDQIKDLLEGKAYFYQINGEKYAVIDAKAVKVAVGKDYNYIFNKDNGNFMRWGKTYEDDPAFSPIGGEILDIEVTTSCNGINGKLCQFCSPKGTKINTVNGSKNIENIKKEDMVIGYDISKSQIKIQEVIETYKRQYTGHLVCFDLDNGETLKLTPEHIVILKNGIEKQAKNVKKNDEIISF